MEHFFILQAQPLRETDWRLDIFSRKHGRLLVNLNAPKVRPDMFTLYQAQWPQQELPALKGWQTLNTWPLADTVLYCGFYLTELLGQLLPSHEAFPHLFDHYQHALAALAQGAAPEPWLRTFETQLLQTLGYGFAWQTDSQGRAVHERALYQFKPQYGLTLTGAMGPCTFLGADILAFAQGSSDPQHWRMARVILRTALDAILTKPLYSRDLLAGPKIFTQEQS